MKDRVIIAMTTCPEGAGRSIAEALVTDQLAACVQQLPAVHSTYRWKRQVITDREALSTIKTTRGLHDALATRIRELHLYELPELIAVEVATGSEACLDWVRAETRPAHEA